MKDRKPKITLEEFLVCLVIIAILSTVIVKWSRRTDQDDRRLPKKGEQDSELFNGTNAKLSRFLSIETTLHYSVRPVPQ